MAVKKKPEIEQLEAYKTAAELMSALFYGSLVKAMMPKMDVVVLEKEAKKRGR